MTLPIKGGGVLRTSSYAVLTGRSTLCTPHGKQKLHEFPGEGAMKRTRCEVWVLNSWRVEGHIKNARPALRPPAEALALVVYVSRKRTEGAVFLFFAFPLPTGNLEAPINFWLPICFGQE